MVITAIILDESTTKYSALYYNMMVHCTQVCVFRYTIPSFLTIIRFLWCIHILPVALYIKLPSWMCVVCECVYVCMYACMYVYNAFCLHSNFTSCIVQVASLLSMGCHNTDHRKYECKQNPLYHHITCSAAGNSLKKGPIFNSHCTQSNN